MTTVYGSSGFLQYDVHLLRPVGERPAYFRIKHYCSDVIFGRFSGVVYFFMTNLTKEAKSLNREKEKEGELSAIFPYEHTILGRK